jgi:7-cyano-7-deazaguanine synthase in queuosine biosynthesis
MADQIEVRLNGPSLSSERSGLSLTIGSRDVEMCYRIDALSRTFVSALPPVVHDLLDIAATVYAADCAVSRGGLSDEGMGQNWRRRFHLVVPVRDPARWSRNTVNGALSDCLGFLSEDFWSFEFRQAETIAPRQGLFDFSDQPDFGPTRDQMFSGGLDSFAGALEELIEREERVVLVSHGSATKLAPVQKRLVDAMRQKIKADRLRHVSVKAQLANRARREGTQRTRSFLFAALGIAVARGYGLNRATFFENGVVSLNLPPVTQVVGARATRTTHPKVLRNFERLFRALFDAACEVRNPYALRTKAEIVGTIQRLGFAEHIRDAHSCADVHNRTHMHSHCGRCSQCVDRRIAVLSSGQGANDPVEAYASDPLRGTRPSVTDKEMVLSYVRNARFYAVCTPEQFCPS